MGYFNYFIKSFIRIFTRKFFWVILIFFLLFLGLILIDKVNAQIDEGYFVFYKGTVRYRVPVPYSDMNVRYNILANNQNDNIYLVACSSSYAADKVIYYQVNSNNTSTIGPIYTWRDNYYTRLNCSWFLYNSSTNTFDKVVDGQNSTSNKVSMGANNSSVWSCLDKNCLAYFMGPYGGTPIGEMQVNEPMRFLTNYAEMCDLNYSYLSIDGGSNPYTYTLAGQRVHAFFKFEYTYEGETLELPFNYDWVTYTTNSENTESSFVINIPKNALHSLFKIRPNTSFSYKLTYTYPYPDPLNPRVEVLDTQDLTYVITQEEADTINGDSERWLQQEEERKRQEQLELQRQQIALQQQQNQSLQDINDSINNPNVDNSVLGDMPQASTIQDNTGISAIFQQMYNAFCTNQVISFTLDVPFVNESITIDSDYSNNYPVQLRTMAGVFWWFVIGLFVLKDVRSIINKIAEGNVENVGSDVQKEVL